MGQCLGSRRAADAVAGEGEKAARRRHRRKSSSNTSDNSRMNASPASSQQRAEGFHDLSHIHIEPLEGANESGADAVGAGGGRTNLKPQQHNLQQQAASSNAATTATTSIAKHLHHHNNNNKRGSEVGDQDEEQQYQQHLLAMESMTARIEQGSAYLWLRFSYANPSLAARPLVVASGPYVTLATGGGGATVVGGGATVANGAFLLEAPQRPVARAVEEVVRTAGRGGRPPAPSNGFSGGNNNNNDNKGDTSEYEAADLHPGDLFFRRPGEIRGRRFTVRNCTGARVLLLDGCGSVAVANCHRCFLFIGPTMGVVQMEKCTGCVVVAACGQARLLHCHDTVLSLLTTGLPTLEGCTSIGVTSLSGWYAYSEMPLHLRAANLSPFINNYTTVRDTTPPPPPQQPQQQSAAVQSPRGGGGGGGPPFPAARRNFYYLDPWDFDHAVWEVAVSAAMQLRGLTKSSSLVHSRRPRRDGDGDGDDDDDDDATFSSCEEDDDDDKNNNNNEDEDGVQGGGQLKQARRRRRAPMMPALSAVYDHHHPTRGRKEGASGGSRHTWAEKKEEFNVAEARAARATLVRAPLRLLDVPAATMSVPHPTAGKEKEKEKEKQHKGRATATPPASLTLHLPPLSPQTIEGVLGLYTGAVVAPATLGACIIPKCFFAERWRLKLFVVSNKNGGWGIAHRIARDIELSRRQQFVEYARTLPLTTDAPGENTGKMKKEEDEDDGDAHEHRQIPLCYRSGPVLLLNSVELRCTETVMREFVAPTFYKLTEPVGTTTTATTAATPSSPQTGEDGGKNKKGKNKGGKGEGEGADGHANAHHHHNSNNNGGSSQHPKKTREQRAQEEAAAREDVAIRRMFGKAIQRMTGQACVLLLALVAPGNSSSGSDHQNNGRGEEAGNAVNGAGGGQNHTERRRADGQRIFQPLSTAEEEEEEAIVLGPATPSSASSSDATASSSSTHLSSAFSSDRDSDDDDEADSRGEGGEKKGERHHHATIRPQRQRRGSRSPGASADDDKRGKKRRKDKRDEKKKRRNRSAPTFREADVAAAHSQEERAWPRCVILNASIPLRHVALLQSNVFFKAAIAGAAAAGSGVGGVCGGRCGAGGGLPQQQQQQGPRLVYRHTPTSAHPATPHSTTATTAPPTAAPK